MLDLMRKNVKSIMVKTIISLVVISFIGTIFLVWGVGGRKENNERTVGTVFGEEVPYLEYFLEYRNLYEYYRNQFKENWSEEMVERLNLKKSALDNVINRRVLIHEATKRGITASDTEVKDKIKSMPMFQQNGQFDSSHYARVLEYGLHMDPASFENQIKQGIIIERMQDILQGGIKVSQQEILDNYSQQNEKVEADYLLLSPKDFASEIKVSADEVQEFFEKHKNDYQEPAKRKIQYVYINSGDFKASLTVADEAVEKYYETHVHKYQIPKEVKARHILIKTDPKADEKQKKEAREKAEGLLKRIKDGEDFAKLAQEFSEDPGSAAKGGDLGFFGKGRMTPSFEQAAFALEKDKVSEVVESPFGYHIIKVEDIQEERTKALPEVKEEILQELLDEEAWEVAENETYNILRDFYKSGQFEEIATKKKYALGDTEFSSDAQIIPNIGRSEEFVKVAFEVKKDEFSKPVRVNTGFYILRLLEELPSGIPELAKVEPKITQALKEEKAGSRVKEVAEELYKKMKDEGFDLASLAEEYKQYNLKVNDSGEVSRQGYIKGLGANQELTNALFDLKEGEVTGPINTNRGYCLAVLKKRTSVDLKKFEEEKENISEQIIRSKQNQFFNVWVERVKKENKIIVDYTKV